MTTYMGLFLRWKFLHFFFLFCKPYKWFKYFFLISYCPVFLIRMISHLLTPNRCCNYANFQKSPAFMRIAIFFFFPKRRKARGCQLLTGLCASSQVIISGAVACKCKCSVNILSRQIVRAATRETRAAARFHPCERLHAASYSIVSILGRGHRKRLVRNVEPVWLQLALLGRCSSVEEQRGKCWNTTTLKLPWNFIQHANGIFLTPFDATAHDASLAVVSKLVGRCSEVTSAWPLFVFTDYHTAQGVKK